MKRKIRYAVSLTLLVILLAGVKYLFNPDADTEAAVIAKYHKAYQTEIKKVWEAEKRTRSLLMKVDSELAHVRSDTSNSVEAGMKESFLQGISYGLNRKHQAMVSHMPMLVDSLHARYKSLVKSMGCDPVEFERIMYEEERANEDSLCQNVR